MTMEINPLGDSFALEITGIDLWRDADADTVGRIDAVYGTAGVVVFRRQAISEDELVAFSSRFGGIETIVRGDWASRGRPEVILISNMRDAAGDAIGGLGEGELVWHTDQSYMARPATGCLLHCVEKPRRGADTSWANLALAYEGLPEATKAILDGLAAVFSYAKRVTNYGKDDAPADDIREQTPDVAHPLVNTHPVTGAKALYLDPGTAAGIVGWPDDEGRALLDELNRHATRADYVYRHQWREGDVVMWDNGFLLHRRDDFDARENRLMKRTTFRLSPERHIVPGAA